MNNYKVYLAPLEGLADGPMRKVLCAHGGYDLCFSEFIRVTDLVVSEKTLLREIPEYQNDCKTDDGTPLRVQLLGDNPKTLAQSAVIVTLVLSLLILILVVPLVLFIIQELCF